LTLASPLALPCPLAGRREPIDVRLVAASARPFAKALATTDPIGDEWFHCRRLPDGSTYVRWAGCFEFLVSADGRQILYHPLKHATAESLTVYLLGQVLSFSLLARGIDPLHGTVVAVDGEAIAFVGDCGYGKSTLGAALLARGCAIVADDLVSLRPTRRGWLVQPGIPRLKLYPRIAARLVDTRSPAPRMIHGTAKRVIALRPPQAAAAPLPLKAVYVLSPPGDGDRIAIEPIAGGDALVEIVRAAFNLLVHERPRFANQFALAKRLAERVPVRRLAYPRTLRRLPAVCDAVLADAATLSLRT
jgi:hypothetical protein